MKTGLQHMGLGTSNVAASYGFYRDLLGYNIKIADKEKVWHELESTLGELLDMRIIMAINSRGGGVIELVQINSRSPIKASTRWGDIGFLCNGFGVDNLPAVIRRLEELGAQFMVRSYPIRLASGERWESAFLTDPDGNVVELIDTSPGTSRRPAVRGLEQVTVGVRNIEKSMKFYHGILGFDEVILDAEGREPCLDTVFEGELKQRQVFLATSQPARSPLVARGGGRVRLVQTLDYQGKKTFEGRLWGDIGQMEICFESDDIKATVGELEAKKMKIAHYPTYTDMGSGSKGYFAYVEDPDGNNIEFVEAKQILWMPRRIALYVLKALSPVVTMLVR
ncbi:MAG: VOC family protein [bacterium]